MRNKMSLLYVTAIVDIVLGLAILFLSTFIQMNLSDFTRGFCTGVAGVLVIGGMVFLARHFMCKKNFIPKK